ncbi:C2H2 type zinc-finger-domain-containing protein [Lipomyces kononenkoae]|uniref:C2H2 type zinc-finger-domain-containing protein n=1 Tax=Lipomyces kononenkoae TaxID=34357 RepID=A0ACC3T0L9_LIPKO
MCCISTISTYINNRLDIKFNRLGHKVHHFCHVTLALFTCNGCGVGFPTPDMQRRHMKTDWHRYNLKRRVATLPPISAEIFAERVLQQMDATRKNEEKLSIGGGNKKTLRHHKAPSSVATLSVAGDDLDSVIEDESIDLAGPSVEYVASNAARGVDGEDEDEDIDSIIERKLRSAVKLPLSACIFCSAQNFRDVDDSLAHMQHDHGLFIPERNYLVDLKGLVEYLSEKVSIGNACLYCSFIGRSLNSVRDHMIAKQHCKIPYDTEDDQLEISNFYDFSSSYPDDYEEEDDWDDVASGDESPDDDGSTVQVAGGQRQRRTETNLVLDPTGLELSLPLSRLRIGHRSLARYYRQSLRPTTELREGQGTVIAASSRQILATVPRDPIKDRLTKKEWRDQRDKQNRDIRREQRYINQQKHYRDPMLGG